MIMTLQDHLPREMARLQPTLAKPSNETFQCSFCFSRMLEDIDMRASYIILRETSLHQVNLQL